jgi:hypothetical protein
MIALPSYMRRLRRITALAIVALWVAASAARANPSHAPARHPVQEHRASKGHEEKNAPASVFESHGEQKSKAESDRQNDVGKPSGRDVKRPGVSPPAQQANRRHSLSTDSHFHIINEPLEYDAGASAASVHKPSTARVGKTHPIAKPHEPKPPKPVAPDDKTTNTGRPVRPGPRPHTHYRSSAAAASTCTYDSAENRDRRSDVAQPFEDASRPPPLPGSVDPHAPHGDPDRERKCRGDVRRAPAERADKEQRRMSSSDHSKRAPGRAPTSAPAHGGSPPRRDRAVEPMHVE